jgi:WD40 repeat protein
MVYLWTMPKLQERRRPLAADVSASKLTFDDKERFLAVGTEQGLVSLYELGGSESTYHLHSHTNTAIGLSFDPSGTWLASATERDGIRLWDSSHPDQSPIVLSAQNFRNADPGVGESSEDVVTDIAFVDRGILAAATGQGTVHLWKVDPQGWIDAATAAAGRSLTPDEMVRYLEYEPGAASSPRRSASPHDDEPRGIHR